jgi:outer membrane protein OmpA-like peptidoglycan-associated protein
MMPVVFGLCLTVPALIVPGLVSRSQAQVSVDMHALNPSGTTKPTARDVPWLPNATPKPAASVAPAGRKPPVADKTVAAGASPHKPSARTSSPSTAETPAPVSGGPASGAPGSSVPIPALPAGQPPAPPASTTVPATAPSTLPMPPPVRLVFETGHTDLTPGDEAEIKELARAIPVPAASSVNVLAYATGKPDDPSTARRLSLSRGMAVRSVLLASGVPSAQIYVRALGAVASDAPADRVELVVAPIGTLTR